MKIKVSALCNIGVFIVLFLAFTRSLHRTLFGGNSGVIVILCFACALIIVSYASSNKKNHKPIAQKETFLWVLVLIIALVNNQDVVQGNRLAYMQIIIGTLLIILLQKDDRWCSGGIKYVKWCTIFLLITGIILLVFKGVLKNYIVPLFYLDSTNEYYSESLTSQINNRYMTGLTSHYSTMGIYMSIGFIFALGSIFNNKDRIRLKDLFLSGSMFIGVFLTGKRSALLFPLLAAIIVYACYFKPKDMRRRYNYIIYGGLAVLAIGIIISIMPGFSGTIARFANIIGSTDLQTITNKRYEMLWLPAVYLFLESPFFGIGWGNFKYSFVRYFTYTANQNNAHNVYLQLLCETGVVGTVIILGAIILTLYKTMRCLNFWRKGRVKLNDSQVAVLGISATMQVYFMLYAISGNPLYDITCYLPYVISVAMSLAVRNGIQASVRK